MPNCSECTYLKETDPDLYGRYWCEKKLERVYAYQNECNRFCRAYNRSSSVAKSYEQCSKDKSSSSTCYLTTMLCDILKLPDNNPFLNTMRDFRNNVLQKDKKYKKLLVEYDIIGPLVARNLNNDPLNKQISATIFYSYIKPITKLIKNKNENEAVNLYKEMTNKLKLFYNINTTLDIDIVNKADISISGHGYYKQKIT